MRFITVLIISFVTVLVLPACKTNKPIAIKTHPHGMPPGQAKKVYGSQSAKPYAPGQVKKKKH